MGRPPTPARPIGDGPLTVEVVRKLLRDSGLPRLEPGDERALALRLNSLRDRFRIDQRAHDINAARDEAAGHLRAAADALARAEAEERRFLAATTFSGGEEAELSRLVLRDRVERIAECRHHIGKMIADRVLVERSNAPHNPEGDAEATRRAAGWQDYASEVFAWLAGVGIKCGRSESGAAAQFFYRLVPHLSGQQPNTVASVGATLKVKLRQSKTGIK